ncbi:unnamed protein product [Leptospira phage LE1]|uniref:Uncharacterized protein n=1 Tax=Leptospira phage LE1 TaxID=137511 RepID=Q6NE36_9CAUD|nr:hypothetical protein HWD53_gp07 [Leptospira phage LE1]CAE14673.1 unnamed protein product [Leptospira phage LE1]
MLARPLGAIFLFDFFFGAIGKGQIAVKYCLSTKNALTFCSKLLQYLFMPRITIDLDEESYELLESDRGELSQQKYMIRLLKEYQLQIAIRKRKKDGKSG